mmetsp:Transcript_67427/g.161748  ORF Transcript_67427/g.161748 Transcript_67427/m.161748 type:complete len:237 (-) Transcript_67427:260-970(-)
MPRIAFSVQCETNFGEAVVLVGDHDTAGGWDPLASALLLGTGPQEYPLWALRTDFQEGQVLEYKFVTMHGKAFRWEEIPNRTLTVGASSVMVVASFGVPGEQIIKATLEESASGSSEPDPEAEAADEPPTDLVRPVDDPSLLYGSYAELANDPSLFEVLEAAPEPELAPELEEESEDCCVEEPVSEPSRESSTAAPSADTSESPTAPLAPRPDIAKKSCWPTIFPCFAGLIKSLKP